MHGLGYSEYLAEAYREVRLQEAQAERVRRTFSGASPGVSRRVLAWAGSSLVRLGTRLQALAAPAMKPAVSLEGRVASNGTLAYESR